MKNYELRMTNYKSRFAKILCVFGVLCALISFVKAQSTNQSYPTPAATNEISGKIPARDIGDARLTSYFYVFNGRQGDVFVNVVTNNFNGDIDVFTADNLKPLTKITIYADDSDRETGRVIYLRQAEKLILRVEGRSPDDNDATFRIKFAGSFEPIPLTAENAAPETPEVKTDNQTGVRVNSVGTIIEAKPKPAPPETIAKKEEKPKRRKPEANDKTAADGENKDKEVAAKQSDTEREKEKPVQIQKESAPKVVVEETLPNQNNTAEKSKEPDSEKNKTAETAEVKENKKETAIVEKSDKNESSKETKKSKKIPKEATAAELENIKLVVLFKDGTKIERSMNEILKVNVDKGVLTVIAKDGSIRRYSILDVEKMTIQ